MYLGEALAHAAAYFRHPNIATKVKNRRRLAKRTLSTFLIVQVFIIVREVEVLPAPAPELVRESGNKEDKPESQVFRLSGEENGPQDHTAHVDFYTARRSMKKDQREGKLCGDEESRS